jgi:hypothetical protein
MKFDDVEGGKLVRRCCELQGLDSRWLDRHLLDNRWLTSRWPDNDRLRGRRK